jgi:hypothetical protein
LTLPPHVITNDCTLAPESRQAWHCTCMHCTCTVSACAHTCFLLTIKSLLLHAPNSQGSSHRRASGILILALCLDDVRSSLCLLPCLVLPQEISALACCRSPFITSYYASLIPPGSSQLLIVMELLVGSVADVVSVRGGVGGSQTVDEGQ